MNHATAFMSSLLSSVLLVGFRLAVSLPVARETVVVVLSGVVSVVVQQRHRAEVAVDAHPGALGQFLTGVTMAHHGGNALFASEDGEVRQHAPGLGDDGGEAAELRTEVGPQGADDQHGAVRRIAVVVAHDAVRLPTTRTGATFGRSGATLADRSPEVAQAEPRRQRGDLLGFTLDGVAQLSETIADDDRPPPDERI